MSSRRVLVTAGAGLIGTAIVRRLLSAGMQVVVLDERSNEPAAEGVPEGPLLRINGRVRETQLAAEALAGCTDVIHLEWSGSVHDATIDPVKRHELSVDPAVRLLEMARQGGMRFLFASTCPYRGDTLELSAEDAPLSEKSIYGQQKRYVETIATAYSRQFGLPTCSIRIFNAYGRGGRPKLILNQLKSAIENGMPITLNGDGEQVRDFVHVDDVAEAFFAALTAPMLGGEVINVGTGVGTSMNQLIRLVEKVTSASIPIVHAPAKSEESRFLVADIRRAEERLSWRPQVDLETGLRRVFAGGHT